MSNGEIEDIELEVNEDEKPIVKLLRDHIARGREHNKIQSQNFENLAKLNVQMIYLCAAGKFPDTNLMNLDETVSAVLGESII